MKNELKLMLSITEWPFKSHYSRLKPDNLTKTKILLDATLKGLLPLSAKLILIAREIKREKLSEEILVIDDMRQCLRMCNSK